MRFSGRRVPVLVCERIAEKDTERDVIGRLMKGSVSITK